MKRNLIIIFLVLLICGCNEKKYEVILKKDLDVEINTEATNISFIKKCNECKVVSKEENIDTSKLGEKKIKLKIQYEKEKYDFSYTIKIVDTIPPTIEAKEKLETTVDKEIDLLKDVVVNDNSLEVITPTIDGEYSFSKDGEYNLKYIALDSSNNKTEFDFVLVVNKKKNEVSNNTTPSNTNGSGVNRTFTTSKGFSGEVKDGITYIEGVMIANKSYPLPQKYNPGGLTSEVINHFNEMASVASNEGINIRIQSGYRSYDTQNGLYNGYVNRSGKEAADTFSARPGHSEHQTGLAFDVCSNQVYDGCINSNFDNTEPANWLSSNAYKYGFILRYPNGKSNVTGYKYESWHFRYVGKELAEKLYNNGDWITLEEYFGIDSTY